MYSGSPVLARPMRHLPWSRVPPPCPANGATGAQKAFTRADRYRCMAFGRLTYRSGPRTRSGSPAIRACVAGFSATHLANANQVRP